MHSSLRVFRTLLSLLAVGATLPLSAQPVSTARVGSSLFVNHGLVGVGRIPASARDRFGETFGSFSAFAFQPGSWTRQPDGWYTGTLFAQPDRGYNVNATLNYTPRVYRLNLVFRPAPAGAASQDQVGLTLIDTIKYTEADGTPLTSFDPGSNTSASRTGFPVLPAAFNNRISLDAEGIVVNADGSLWVSDEYGPYIWRFGADGKLLSAIRPPEALVGKRNGADSFSSNNSPAGQPAPSPANPVTGRQNNQGLEGLSVSPDGRTLFALLQSAARQDGGTGGTSATRFNTRLLAYDISGPSPVLRGHYVVQLPTFTSGTSTLVAAQSEMLALNNTQFLVLARDSGNGRGLNPTSRYRNVLVYDVAAATNLVGTEFETAGRPVAPNGVLDAGIRPAARSEFVNLNVSSDLARFGLKNGPTDDANNLSEKWEALALMPALDPFAPDDYFLFIGNDNDFQTTDGFHDGASYNAGVDNDSMVLVYRVSLPGRLLNVSSRGRLGAGADAHIVGFVVSGARPKTVLVRGVGPALGAFGVTGAAFDPSIQVFSSTGSLVAANDNWGDLSSLADASQRAGAFPLALGSRDAALLLNLGPGNYTVVASATGPSGIGLVEVYELP
ncbi:MAG: esterase-like activity of phytase family protein [Verrucomicrobia bacterium]|nr:esterase-like activity of phytase family protein [Verrucomicrobiota bacterium]